MPDRKAYIEEDVGTQQSLDLSPGEVEEMQKKVAETAADEDGSPEDTEELVEDYVHSLPTSTPDHDISQFPFVMNDRVQKWIDYFTQKDRERFIRFMKRGSQYRTTIEDILAREGLPKELYFLAFIESGFGNFAKSRAKAVGIWQFIRGTGQRYGLRIDAYVDERSDPLRSTYAAARYLGDLFRVYQDWNLAMASYNAGEGRILRGIMKSSHRDYWRLLDQRMLPAETSDYVPKVIAAALIGQNPARYGLPEFSPSAKWEVKAVRASARQSVVAVARNHGVSKATLLVYNPHLRGGYVPGGRGHYNIWVPASGADIAVAELVDEEVMEASSENAVAETPVSVGISKPRIHRVRRGETLAVIARRYGITVTALKAANQGKVGGSTIYAGSRLSIPSGSEKVETASVPAARLKTHVVRRGENLNSIAQKYGTTVAELRHANSRLRGNRIYAGNTIKIPAAARTASMSKSNQVVYHLVRRGENLAQIARKYGIGVGDIRSHNESIGRRNRIYAGTRLKIVLAQNEPG